MVVNERDANKNSVRHHHQLEAIRVPVRYACTGVGGRLGHLKAIAAFPVNQTCLGKIKVESSMERHSPDR